MGQSETGGGWLARAGLVAGRVSLARIAWCDVIPAGQY